VFLALSNRVASAAIFPYGEGMDVSFTPEQEAQIAQIATKAGTDAEHLVKGHCFAPPGAENSVAGRRARIAGLAPRRNEAVSPPRHLRRCPLNRGLLTQMFLPMLPTSTIPNDAVYRKPAPTPASPVFRKG